MESIDRLKKYVRANTDRTVLLTKYPEQYGVHCSTVINDLIDDIESEVEECYVELPKDADGEHIHVGDQLQDAKVGGGWDAPFEVCHMTVYTDIWRVYGSNRDSHIPAACLHKPPTVEDVLRDFAYCCEEGATEQSIDEIIAEYAPKLQLRQEG